MQNYDIQRATNTAVRQDWVLVLSMCIRVYVHKLSLETCTSQNVINLYFRL